MICDLNKFEITSCQGASFIYNDNNYTLVIYGEVFIGSDIVNEREVLKHILEEKVHELSGRFIIALFDKKSEIITLFRDPTGLNRGYFLFHERNFHFSVEQSSIFKKGKSINREYLKNYLEGKTYNDFSTIYNGIYRALPGKKIIIYNGTITVETYYNFKNNRIQYKRNQEYEEEFYFLFKQAVERSLKNTTEIGISLSGGLDSTSIYSIIKHEKIIADKIETFSLTYPNNIDIDEKKWIEETTSLYTPVTHTYIDASDDWTFKYFEENFKNFSEPYHLIGANLNNTLIRAMAEKGKKYHITGHGGDHVLYGDYYYLNDLFNRRKFSYLYKEVKELSKVYSSKELMQAIKNNFNEYSEKCYLTDFHSNWSDHHFNWNENEMDQYFEEIINNSGHEWIDMNINTPFSVQNRYPFLDKDLVEFLLNIPVQQKWNGIGNKVILRNSLKDILPVGIRLRKTKSSNLPQLVKGLNVEKGNMMKFSNFNNLSSIFNIDKNSFIEDFEKLSSEGNNNYYGIISLTRLLASEVWLDNKLDR